VCGLLKSFTEMTRSEIRTFLQNGVAAINPVMPFGSGRITEWNSNRSNEYPGVWWESNQTVDVEIVTSTLPSNSWPIIIHIGKKDRMDSSTTEYEQLIDDCDYIAQQLVRQYNQVLDGYEGITLTGISRQPFIKKHADIVTGVILTMTLNAPDTTDLC
jgi:hypothetical protein